MKVGIVTFHRAHNCGAMLQCLALVTVLQRMGHDVRVLDCNNVGEGILFPNVRNPRVWLGWLYRLVVSGALSQRLWFRYWCFMKRFFPMTKKIDIGEHLGMEFDKIVLGSDQVLNPLITGRFLQTFLLKDICCDEKKIAYAASFGLSTLPDSYRQIFATQLSKFKALGIREESGVKICTDELQLSAPLAVTVDPTLLLDADVYKNFETFVNEQDEYVLVYWIGYSTEYIMALAKRIAKLYGIKVVVAAIVPFKGGKSWRTISPGEFLYLVRNAKIVVTTSFHGTSFAVINRKPFVTVIPSGLNVADRIVGLLQQLSLSSQIVNEGDFMSDDILRAKLDVDFSAAEENLCAIRQMSLNFLNAELGPAEVLHFQ
ncbi:MAG: polysaccharide pyruvyl transferase family protein [Kiritimatiellae bacterium]|nr:polysaccharide pyruvyl transferase family protein [Kiritimatiellia bacterium]